MQDGRGIVCALKLFLAGRPHRARAIAGFIAMRRDLWPAVGAAVRDLPALVAALRRLVVEVFRTDAAEASTFVAALGPGDFWGRAALAHVQRLLPAHFGAFCQLARAGALAFRTAAVYASAEEAVWTEFCARTRGSDALPQLLAVVDDYAKSGNCATAVRLLSSVTSIFAVGVPELHARIAPFAWDLFRKLNPHYCENIILCVKILCFVHPHASVIRPLIGDAANGFSPQIADLTFRYLWDAKADEAPDFLVFRLRLLLRRMSAGQAPPFWTDEMLQMK
jgi:hypothetical protein